MTLIPIYDIHFRVIYNLVQTELFLFNIDFHFLDCILYWTFPGMYNNSSINSFVDVHINSRGKWNMLHFGAMSF